MAKISKTQLENLLLDACDIIRGKAEASQFKELIFGIIFLKRLSDQFDQDKNAAIAKWEAEGKSEKVINRHLENQTFAVFKLPEDAHWNSLKNLTEKVGKKLTQALKKIEEANDEIETDLLKQIDYTKKIGSKAISDTVLKNLINHFDSKIPLSDDDFAFEDLLGTCYEYLIAHFADNSGKKGGEHYTPSEVVRLMVGLVEPTEGMHIYDPTVGSGGMLIQSRKYVESRGGNAENLRLYGQDSEGSAWRICTINHILHGAYSQMNIKQGDTLNEPLHANGGIDRIFDRVLANPPFSQDYSWAELPGNEAAKEARFPIRLPEKDKGDFMFIQHMLNVLKEDGKCATVVPLGPLFRGSTELEARKKFIDDKTLRAVIALPPSLFYNTSIPAAIMIFDMEGGEDRSGVLFINASKGFEDCAKQNKLREEDIEKILHVYRNPELPVPSYSKVVTWAELESEEGAYNCNIRRWVNNTDMPTPQDVRAHLHGGVPLSEIENAANYWSAYNGVRGDVFQEAE